MNHSDINSPNLFYPAGNQRLPLPPWADFFIKLGSVSATYSSPESFLSIVLSVPARLLASPLAAFGAVWARADIPVSDETDYFDFLCELPIQETKLSFLRGENKVTGTLVNVEYINGERYLVIEVGKSLFKRTANTANEIFVASANMNHTSEAGKKISDELRPLLSQFSDSTRNKFCYQSRLESLIIGPQKEIEAEIKDYSFYTSPEAKRFHLANLLRVKGFGGTEGYYRTEICGPRTVRDNSCEQPYVLILDGSYALLNHFNTIPKNCRIVILERTARRLDDAIDVIKNEYINYRLETKMKTVLPSPPDGVDMLAYEVSE